ncbi:MAG: ATP-binding protein [Armatimonadota bacterium]|nr:ATP-binding protein [Armatimonadota bacterium]
MTDETYHDARTGRQSSLALDDLLSLDRLCWLHKSGADISDCLNLMLTKAAAATESSCGAVLLRDERSGKRRVAASFGLPEDSFSTRQMREVNRILALGNEPYLLNSKPERPSPLMEALEKASAKSGMAMPMRVDGSVTGLVVLGSERETYSEQQLAVAGGIARYSALAMERANACKDSEDRLGFLETIAEISSVLASERDLNSTLSVVVEQAAALVNAESTAVGLLEEDGSVLRCLVAHGPLADALRGQTFDLTEWPLRSVFKSRKAQALVDPSNNPRLRPKDVETWRVKSALLAPLTLKDTVIGLLAAANKHGGRQFSAVDVRVFETLANHAAIAISNSRLFERNQRALARLEAERTKLEGILENLADGVIVCDADHRITLVNRAAEEIMETSAESLLGHDLVSLHPIEYRKVLRQMLHAVSSADGAESPLHEAKVEYGHKIIRISASPVVVGGSYQGFAMALQDVTAAEEVGRAKAEFVSTVAHELKTPLTSLKGSIGLMLASAPDVSDARFRELAAIAQNNSNRLIRLVDDMMDIAKIEAGRMGLRVEPVSLYECAVDAVKDVQQSAAEKCISLTVRLVGAPPLVPADRDRVEQVITNLLNNAIRFSPENGEVIVSIRRIHGFLRVSVQDFGPGIPRKDLKRVFEKFYQVGGPASRKAGGSGLGLAISKAIVEQHGGKMYVRSTLGHGSSFVFTIPAPAGNK